MTDRLFLDTNIFVYSFDKSAPKKATRAAELIRRAIEARQGIVRGRAVSVDNLPASLGCAFFARSLQSSLTAREHVLPLLV